MKMAIEYVEPMLERNDAEQKATIVVATVEGRYSRYRKKSCCSYVENYGYNVIDLGKDVPASLIVETALKEHAKVIGLSALMTTTMMRMKDVVELAKKWDATARSLLVVRRSMKALQDEDRSGRILERCCRDCVKLVDRLLEE